ncbi:MAG TPA: RbsD/FucU domain-containing protein [Fimbriimonas sp.]|nr:RbsD/FucU domain-containing protein [Fimbriimonas sp.]
MSLLCTFILPALIASKGTTVAEPSPLSTLLSNRLPSLGHRNWIVVADSAYPLQTAPGIETITVQDDQLSAVRQVLDALKKTRHVKPTIYIDKELKFVTDKLSPGISRYRSSLDSLLKGKNPQQLLHEDIIAKLDEAGKTFKVLLIKTPHIQPYTSVFFQLECGYWTAEAEAELRSRMQAGNSGG